MTVSALRTSVAVVGWAIGGGTRAAAEGVQQDANDPHAEEQPRHDHQRLADRQGNGFGTGGQFNSADDPHDAQQDHRGEHGLAGHVTEPFNGPLRPLARGASQSGAHDPVGKQRQYDADEDAHHCLVMGPIGQPVNDPGAEFVHGSDSAPIRRPVQIPTHLGRGPP